MRRYYKINLSGFILTLTLLFAGSFFMADSVWGSCRIENISLEKDGNFTKVTIYADKPFEFSHSTEEAKDGKPFRVIIDCKDALFGLPQYNYRRGLPPGIIKAIRTSQFQVVPERIVRVVLDLESPVVYKIIDTGIEKKATVAILSAKAPDFPMWMAAKEKKDIRQLDRKKKRPESSLVDRPSSGKLKSRERKAYVSTQEERHRESKVSRKEQNPPAAQRKGLPTRRVCYADTGEIVQPSGEQLLRLSRLQPEKKGLERKKEERISQVVEVTTPEEEPSPEPSVDQFAAQTVFSSNEKKALENEKKTLQKAREIANGEKAKDKIQPSPPELVSSTPSEIKAGKSEPASSESPQRSLAERSIGKRRISRSPVPLGPFLEAPSSKGDTEREEKMDEALAEKEERKSVSGEVESSVRKGISAVLGTESASAKETKVFPESSMIIQTPSPPESEMELLPQRKMVYYNPGTRRDPFLPLTEREDVSFTEAPLPLAENLKLVGILKDEEGNRALLEDEMGFGYILRKGDKIKNGYVISVEEDRVIFHVEEYGGYRIMELELNPEY